MKTSYSKNQDLRVLKTKQAIIKAFWDLLYEKNINDISITEICKNAGVNRSTFYLHFEDKDQLLVQSIYDSMFKINEETIAKCETNEIAEYYEVIGDITFDILSKKKETYRKLFKHNDYNLFLEPAQSFLSLNINRHIKLIKKSEKGLDLPASLISEFYSGGIISLARWWVCSETYVPKEKLRTMIKILISSFLKITDYEETEKNGSFE